MVYIIASGKGGTGKTALACGLSFAFAERGIRVLMIDGDTATRSLSTAMNVYESAVFDLSDVAFGTVSVAEAAISHPDYGNILVLTSPMEESSLTETCVADAVKQAKSDNLADVIIIDGPAGLGSGFRRCAMGADKGIIVATSDAISLRSADLAAAELERLGVNDLRMVVNRVSKKITGRGGMPNIDDAIDLAALPLIGYIPEDRKVITSLALGIPITKQRGSRAAASYREIAGKLERSDL